MEAAELAAHASVWIPSEPLNQDMDAQLRYLLVMLTSGPALHIIRQQPSVVDLQLGRMMEAAELAAHASVWIPSEPLNQDMDA